MRAVRGECVSAQISGARAWHPIGLHCDVRDMLVLAIRLLYDVCCTPELRIQRLLLHC